MRKSHVVALAIISIVSSASLAAAQAPQAPEAGRHAMRARMQGGRGERGLFRGIALSDAEKTKLKEVRAKYAPERKALHESLKPVMNEVRAARQKGDTAAARAAWDQAKDGREKAKALMDREQADVRAALSPENQKQFDANVQRLAQRRAEWKKSGKHGRNGQSRGQRGQRGQREQRNG